MFLGVDEVHGNDASKYSLHGQPDQEAFTSTWLVSYFKTPCPLKPGSHQLDYDILTDFFSEIMFNLTDVKAKNLSHWPNSS